MTDGWTIELPKEWQTAAFRPGFVRPIATGKLPRGRSALLVMTMLRDGTNVLALTWDRGTRLARTSPHTGWALEERFTGRPPGPGEGSIIQMWRAGVDCMVKAAKDAEAAIAAGWEPTPTQFCVSNERAMDVAYAAYCDDDDAPPLTREQFELATELLATEQLVDEEAPGDA